jgi:hypothetical protein
LAAIEALRKRSPLYPKGIPWVCTHGASITAVLRSQPAFAKRIDDLVRDSPSTKRWDACISSRPPWPATFRRDCSTRPSSISDKVLNQSLRTFELDGHARITAGVALAGRRRFRRHQADLLQPDHSEPQASLKWNKISQGY